MRNAQSGKKRHFFHHGLVGALRGVWNGDYSVMLAVGLVGRKNRPVNWPLLDHLLTCLLGQMFQSEAITDEVVHSASQGSAVDRERILKAITPEVFAMIAVRFAPTPAQFHAVEELAQETLMALSNGLANLRTATVAGLRSYASGIVTRRVATFLKEDHSKRSARLVSLDSSTQHAAIAGPLRELLTASGLTPRSALVHGEEISRVIEALAQLKSSYREVITLSFFDQLSMDEAADRMNLSRSAASMLLMRAMKKLRQFVTNHRQGNDSHG